MVATKYQMKTALQKRTMDHSIPCCIIATMAWSVMSWKNKMSYNKSNSKRNN